MGWIILILLGIGLAVSPQIFGYRFTIALAALMGTSNTVIDADAVGHLKRIYMGS